MKLDITHALVGISGAVFMHAAWSPGRFEQVWDFFVGAFVLLLALMCPDDVRGQS